MALNPFFLQGSQSEQRLIQELINEQLTIYGVEVIYLPRSIVNHDNILNEVESSKFDDNFSIEAYVNTYDGYGGAGDIMTKFGMSLKDELTLTISKERYEDFIATFVSGAPPTYNPHLGTFNQPDDDFVTTRPREGDLVYFPLGKRLFEVKFVEHEQPFYQLGKNYVYQLKCELFEYEDSMNTFENLSTGSEEIDDLLVDTGFITSLILVGTSSTATATTQISTGYVRSITLNDDGYGYTSTPTVSFTPSPEGSVDANATAVAITTVRNNVYSVKEILLTNAGVGYTEAPTITISGGGGVGASATCNIETSLKGIRKYTITDNGSGYTSAPTVTIPAPVGSGDTATARVVVSTANTVSAIYITDPGIGYTVAPSITISSPTSGIGTFQFNEVVTGSPSGATGRVKSWDGSTNTLNLGATNGTFGRGDTVVGSASSASYKLSSIKSEDVTDKYDKGDEIETFADTLLDFTETNPFGTY